MANPSRPPGQGPTAAELAAARDVISRAKAADSTLRNADELLVCAALALRAGEFGGVPSRAADGMGKFGSKAKHVRDWVARIEKLEQASGSTSAVNSSGLLVHPQWISKETPGIHQLEVEQLLLSAGKRHGKRKLAALTTTPGGTAREVSATVDYTLPPAAGETKSATKQRAERHYHREQKELRALDLSGVGLLSEALLVRPTWIARNTTNLEEGSFFAGEMQVDNEARHTARSMHPVRACTHSVHCSSRVCCRHLAPLLTVGCTVSVQRLFVAWATSTYSALASAGKRVERYAASLRS
jgi:hypothetical protein